MLRPFRLYEIVADGLPVVVGVCRADQQPECRGSETVRWLLSHLDQRTAAGLAHWRIRQIVEWSGEPPRWLRSHIPRAPEQRRPGFGRAVIREHPGGHVERFPSVQAAANAIGRDRVVIMRLLTVGGPDFAGCTWRDDSTGVQM
jgi:hypothetical protein